jgi:hypothetical protein
MSASFSLMLPYGLHTLTRKLAIELLAVSLPIVVALTAHPAFTKPIAPSPQSSAARAVADPTNAKVKEFMIRVALSHVVSLNPTAAEASATVVVPNARTTSASLPALPRPAVAPVELERPENIVFAGDALSPIAKKL